VLVLAAGAAAGLVALLSAYRYAPLSAVDEQLSPPMAESRDELRRLRRDVERLRALWARHGPRGVYIVVDRANNRLYLRQGDSTLLAAVASAGSGFVLREPGGQRRTWVFDTPQGVFRVIAKVRNPVWRKPDWAFVETGRPIPADPAERFEYGVLGEYALYFGDGYMIHGTLYDRLLGRSVTHGCIRLGRDDLRRVYEAARVGTAIYIF
jgi:L,D-transpeptidase YbiS